MKLKNLSRLTALLLAFILCFSTVAEAAVPLSDLTTYGLLDGLLEMLGIKRVSGCLDYPLTLEFDKSLDNGEYTYQWYKITGFNSSETVPSDATPSQLTIKPTTSTGYYYCKATKVSTGSTTKSSAFVVEAYGPDHAVDYLKVLSDIRSFDYPGDKMPYRVEAHKYMTESWNTVMDGQNLAQAILTASTTSTDYPKLLCTCCIAADGSISDEILLHPYVAHAKGCPWEDYIIQLPIPPQPKLYYGEPQGEQYTANSGYSLPMTKAIILPAGGSATVSVSGSTVSAQARGVSSPTQWQVYNGSEWANMLGETSDTLLITTAKLQTIFNLTGVAHLRYYDRTNDVVLGYVDVSSQANAGEYPEEEAAAQTFTKQTRDANGFTVEVKYVFENNVEVATPYTAYLAAGSDFSTTVTFPQVQGYLPYLNGVQQNSLELSYTPIDQNHTYTVVYKPTNVDYVIRHYKQNAENDGYTLAEQKKTQGLTNSQVPDVAHIRKVDDGNGNVTTVVDPGYEGFYALQYERPLIAADGSTEVEVYYDRYYYLMNFDLDGGYGVEPIYARYGAPIGNVGTPTKAGYTFDGWSLNGEIATVPGTMPATNSTYKALWTEADSSFTVVYWLKNADDDEYSVFGTKVVDAQTGDAVTDAVYNSVDYKVYGNANITLDSNMQELVPFIEYEKADASVTVAGDKSSIVNVYYTRKAYTLKFYYAMEDTTNNKYYVIGGSSYAFGKSGDNTANSLDNLTKYYMDGGSWVNQRGQVDEIPQLNATGTARKYVSGSDAATKKSGGVTYKYKYYYISFTAKYGADISNLWPCNVFSSVTRSSENTHGKWDGKEAYVSAWNGEHHVYYSQHNSNQTIKGNYNQLDTQLLWDVVQFKAYADGNNTVDYVCFWENGANIGWSVPELYYYRVWVPVLEGQVTDGLETMERDGIIYFLRNTYDTVDDSTWREQTPPAINGLTYIDDSMNGTQITSGFDTTLYHEAWNVDFFYTRNLYNLTFQNDGDVEKTEQVYFEAPLTDKSFEPSYPTSLEAGGYEFEGWYTSPTCKAGTKFKFENSTMPANDLLLYANWVPKVYAVAFYQSESGMNDQVDPDDPRDVYVEVPHNSIIADYCATNDMELPDVEEQYKIDSFANYEFVGWFYRDANGVEKAFSIDATPIKGDMNIYAKWSSNTLMPYTILYKLQGTDTQIAAPTTGQALAGTTKTFEAKGGTDLYTAYQEGYFPVVKSHSLTIDIDDDSKNTFTFEYVQVPAVPYKVYYVTDDQSVDKSLGTVDLNDTTYTLVADTKVVSNNHKAVVTENYARVSGMLPDAYQKRLVVSVNEDGTPNTEENVIIFYYTKDDKHAYWTITHYTENLATDTSGNRTWTEYSYSESVGDIGNSYSASKMTIPGFTYDGTVNGTLTSGKLTADGLDLKLYYTRNSYPYQVRYLEQGTGKQLHDPNNGTGKFGQVISESAIDITNYTAVAPTSQTLNIRIEESTEAKLNIITFYYTENVATINYIPVGPDGKQLEPDNSVGNVDRDSETPKVLSGTAQGSTATAASNVYKFVGWYSDAACSTPVDASWVEANNKITPQKQDSDNDEATAPVYVAATYYAKFEYNVADLTISKSGLEAGDSAIFTVTVRDPNGIVADEVFTIVLTGPDTPSATIKDLQIGYTYSVVETSWSWRYTGTALTNVSGTIQVSNPTVTFTNTSTDKWLYDESAVRNVFNNNN